MINCSLITFFIYAYIKFVLSFDPMRHDGSFSDSPFLAQFLIILLNFLMSSIGFFISICIIIINNTIVKIPAFYEKCVCYCKSK